jgi:hypothetical protein
VNLAGPTHTVGSCVDEWLDALKAHDGTRPSTLARYRQVVETHLRPGLGRTRSDRLTPTDVHAFRTRCRATVAPGTVSKIHAVLRAALADAERMDLVVRNLARTVRVRSAVAREHRVLSVADARRLLDAVRDDRLEASSCSH